MANALYGVTMEELSVSKLISLIYSVKWAELVKWNGGLIMPKLLNEFLPVLLKPGNASSAFGGSLSQAWQDRSSVIR